MTHQMKLLSASLHCNDQLLPTTQINETNASAQQAPMLLICCRSERGRLGGAAWVCWALSLCVASSLLVLAVVANFCLSSGTQTTCPPWWRMFAFLNDETVISKTLFRPSLLRLSDASIAKHDEREPVLILLAAKQ